MDTPERSRSGGRPVRENVRGAHHAVASWAKRLAINDVGNVQRRELRTIECVLNVWVRGVCHCRSRAAASIGQV